MNILITFIYVTNVILFVIIPLHVKEPKKM